MILGAILLKTRISCDAPLHAMPLLALILVVPHDAPPEVQYKKWRNNNI